jgi:hypothetical protein
MIDYLPSYYNGKIRLLNPKFPNKEFLFVYSDSAAEAKMIDTSNGHRIDVPYETFKAMISTYERNGWVSTN